MAMRIETLKKPRLPLTKMICDKPIDNKLLKYPAVETNFGYAFFVPIVGPQGSGKTSIIISFLKSIMNRCFEDVFLVMPEISMMSISKQDNVFAKLDEERNIYHDFNEETMSKIENHCIENSMEKEHSLLIIDDFGSVFQNEKLPENKILKRMSIKTRHYKCSIVILLQNLYQLPKKLREVSSSIIFFNLGKSMNEKLIREFLPYTDEQIQEIMKLFKDPHDWLIFSIRHRRIFYKLEKELLFDE